MSFSPDQADNFPTGRLTSYLKRGASGSIIFVMGFDGNQALSYWTPTIHDVDI